MICCNCGSEFEGRKRKFCNKYCNSRYQKRKRNGYNLLEYEVEHPIFYMRVMLKCLTCGNDFVRAKNGGTDGKQYTKCCSRKCGSIHGGAITREITSIKAMAANVIANTNKRSAILIKTREKRIIIEWHTDAMYNHCIECGSDVVSNTKIRSRSYCIDCKKAKTLAYRSGQSYKDMIRKNKLEYGSHIKRAKKYGVEHERVNRVKVFELYGWKCAECGVDTPKDIMRTFDNPNAPTLDHIFPMSKGGGHLYSNAQLLCRRCNTIKGATVPPRGVGCLHSF